MKLTLLLLSSLLLLGCWGGPRVVVEHKLVYIPILCPQLPQVAELHTRQVLPMAIRDEFGAYWVGISGKDYEHLAYNNQEFLRVMKGQNGVIRYYQQCIVDFNAELEKKEAENVGTD
jgi:hypothetical protein